MEGEEKRKRDRYLIILLEYLNVVMFKVGLIFGFFSNRVGKFFF